jgi:protein involved in polysaccharide export with SLBB domain
MSKWTLRAGFLAVFLTAGSASAQERPNFDPTRPGITRAELTALHTALENAAQSTAYSAALRNEARLQAGRAKARLEQGDFKVGDRIYVNVEREAELDTTFTVNAAMMLPLPVVGPLPLKGVLRGELQSHLRTHVGKIRRDDPVVQATPMLQLAITGEVRNGGYYAVNIDAPITDALMEAGGPTATASLGEIRIERGSTVLLKGAALQQDIAEGKTPAQLDLRPGDRLVVPTAGGRSVGELVRLIIVALPSLAFLFTSL